MDNKIVQCKLVYKNAVLVTWLPDDKRLKKGVFITLVGYDENIWWRVEDIGESTDVDKIISAHNSKIIHQKDFIRDKKTGGFRNVKIK